MAEQPRELQVAIEGRQPSIVLPEGHALSLVATPQGVVIMVDDCILFERSQPFTAVIGSGPASGAVEAKAQPAITERQRMVVALAVLQQEVDVYKAELAAWSALARDETPERMTGEQFAFMQRTVESSTGAAEDRAALATRLDASESELAKMTEFAHLLATGLSDAEARGTVWPDQAPEPEPS